MREIEISEEHEAMNGQVTLVSSVTGGRFDVICLCYGTDCFMVAKRSGAILAKVRRLRFAEGAPPHVELVPKGS
jgi:hypothetical protein